MNLNQGFSRWRSRKFLMALGTQVAAVLAIIFPEHQSAIQESTVSLVSLVVMALTTLGYLATEGAIDRARESRP